VSAGDAGSGDSGSAGAGSGSGDAASGSGDQAADPRTDQVTWRHQRSSRPTPDRLDDILAAKILTVSDGVAEGVRSDRSGDALVERLGGAGFVVVNRQVTPDGEAEVGEALVGMAQGFAGLIVTTGGTGFGPRDLTPEGTRRVLDREAPGLAEAMRLVNPLGRLSRSTAGTIGQALVLNLPGSTSGALECLDAVLDVVPHALELLRGERPH
jgi:molybdenum cofactor synthesis domain-containing protein